LPATPAIFEAGRAERVALPVAGCEFGWFCAAASVEANPPGARCPEAGPTEVAMGSAEILFEMASRMGIATTFDQLCQASRVLLHSGGQPEEAILVLRKAVNCCGFKQVRILPKK
jgi:hypothetical protein